MWFPRFLFDWVLLLHCLVLMICVGCCNIGALCCRVLFGDGAGGFSRFGDRLTVSVVLLVLVLL